MSGLSLKLRRPLRGSPWRLAGQILLGLALCAWTALAVIAASPEVELPARSSPLVIVGPAAALGAWLAWRPGPHSRELQLAAAWTATVAAALVLAKATSARPEIALAIPAVAVSALVCMRFPGAAVVGLFAISGCFGSLTAFLSFPVGSTVDLVLAGLWAGTAGMLVFRNRGRALLLLPGAVAIGIYLAITTFEILTAPTFSTGLDAFRTSAWYLGAGLLVGHMAWTEASHSRLLHGIAVVSLAIGGYAVLRWSIGPADVERELAVRSAGGYNFLFGELRVIGSFASGHQLGAWTAGVTPFCLALALASKGRLRVLFALAAGLCAFALLASGVRAGLVGVAAGVVLTLMLYQLSRGFKGLHLGVTAGATAAVLIIGAVAVATTTETS
ncbi:MAG: hypothetical protein H0V29_13665, partial [Thermoleophilaceae bacterium]|nr:hypothetical protein [Thermoleophilaceae bacterium]